VKKLKSPSDPPACLANLASPGVLDTAEDEITFDALSELTATILGVPIALVCLLYEGKQWFKGAYGLNVAETLRDVTFWAQIAAESAPLIVCETHADARFADNPLVTGEPHIRFFASAPLRTADGFVLGSLCAIGRQPRAQPTPVQVRMLSLLAAQVVDRLAVGRKRPTERALQSELAHENEEKEKRAAELIVANK